MFGDELAIVYSTRLSSVVSAVTARGVCSVQSDQQPGLAEPALTLLTLNARGLIRLTSDCDRITENASADALVN